jgi:hypothetical protein
MSLLLWARFVMLFALAVVACCLWIEAAGEP